MQFATVAYQVYVLPVLSFLAQFTKPNERVLAAETKALSLLVLGPGRWILKEDLYQLDTRWGQHKAFPCLQDVCLASRIRLATSENSAHSGLGIRHKKSLLQDTILSNNGRLKEWFSWFDGGVLADIFLSYEEIQDLGLDVPSLLDAAAPPVEDEPISHRAKRRKKRFQRTVRNAVSACRRYNAPDRMRHKLDRWQLGGLPRVVSERCHKSLTTLKKLLPPRVSAAVLRTMWNGWCTGRRFQQAGQCCFNCGAYWDNVDSIEHYSRCEIVVDFAKHRLGIRPNIWTIGHLTALGFSEGNCSTEELTVRTIWVYSVYRAHNLLCYRSLSEDESPLDVLTQLAREGALGHGHAMKCLDGIFVCGGTVLPSWDVSLDSATGDGDEDVFS